MHSMWKGIAGHLRPPDYASFYMAEGEVPETTFPCKELVDSWEMRREQSESRCGRPAPADARGHRSMALSVLLGCFF